MTRLTRVRMDARTRVAGHLFGVAQLGTHDGRTEWRTRVGRVTGDSLFTHESTDAEAALTALIGFAACAADRSSTDEETWLSVRASFGKAIRVIDRIGADELAMTEFERFDMDYTQESLA